MTSTGAVRCLGGIWCVEFHPISRWSYQLEDRLYHNQISILTVESSALRWSWHVTCRYEVVHLAHAVIHLMNKTTRLFRALAGTSHSRPRNHRYRSRRFIDGADWRSARWRHSSVGPRNHALAWRQQEASQDHYQANHCESVNKNRQSSTLRLVMWTKWVYSVNRITSTQAQPVNRSSCQTQISPLNVYLVPC